LALGLTQKAPILPAPTTLPDAELAGVLLGVQLVVIHCKATPEPFPYDATIADVISDEIRSLTTVAGLGISVLGAKQGTRLDF